MCIMLVKYVTRKWLVVQRNGVEIGIGTRLSNMYGTPMGLENDHGHLDAIGTQLGDTIV